jgi:REP element-mobilizing transposase RayT
MNYPLAYLITFTTYGTWLHGGKKASVNKEHNRFGEEFLLCNSGLNKKEQSILKHKQIKLNALHRHIVLRAVLEVCEFRGWLAHAVHVRSNHIHIVVSGREKPEKMMLDFKRYATRAIKKDGEKISVEKYWTQHGSTKYIWTKERLCSSIEYVKNGQGKIMAFGNSRALNVNEG